MGSDLTPATLTRTSSASHLRHSPAVFRHASMLILSAQSSHVELVLFVPLSTGSVTVSTSGCASIASSGTGIISISTSNCDRIWGTGGEAHELSLLTKTSDCPPHLSSLQQLGKTCFDVSGCVACYCSVDAPSLARLGSPATLGTTGVTSVAFGLVSRSNVSRHVVVCRDEAPKHSEQPDVSPYLWMGTLRCNSSYLLPSALPSVLLDSLAHL